MGESNDTENLLLLKKTDVITNEFTIRRIVSNSKKDDHITKQIESLIKQLGDDDSIASSIDENNNLKITLSSREKRAENNYQTHIEDIIVDNSLDEVTHFHTHNIDTEMLVSYFGIQFSRFLMDRKKIKEIAEKLKDVLSDVHNNDLENSISLRDELITGISEGLNEFHKNACQNNKLRSTEDLCSKDFTAKLLQKWNIVNDRKITKTGFTIIVHYLLSRYLLLISMANDKNINIE